MTPRDFSTPTLRTGRRAAARRRKVEAQVLAAIEAHPASTLWHSRVTPSWLLLVHRDCRAGTLGQLRVTIFAREAGPVGDTVHPSPRSAAEKVMTWLGSDAERAAPEVLDQAALTWPLITSWQGGERGAA